MRLYAGCVGRKQVSAASLLNLAFAEDEEFGLFCWTAFTTGALKPAANGGGPVVEPKRSEAMVRFLDGSWRLCKVIGWAWPG